MAGPLLLVGGAAAAVGAGLLHAQHRALQRLAARPDPDRRTDLGRIDWPGRHIPTPDGGSLWVTERGAGATVLLSHGYLADSSTWSLVAPMLVDQGYRVVLYEQRGHGASRPVGRDGYGIGPIGDDLATVLRHLVPDGGEPIVYGGHSMGGVALFSAVERHPEIANGSIRRAVLASTLARGPGRPRFIALKGPVRRSRWYQWASSTRLQGLYFAQVGFGPDAAMSHVTSGWQAYVRTPPDAQNGAGEPLLDFDLRHAVGRLTMPVHLLGGSDDHVTPPPFTDEIARRLDDVTVTELDGLGHITPLEAAADVTKAIIDALES